jgi:hypothetical protein
VIGSGGLAGHLRACVGDTHEVSGHPPKRWHLSSRGSRELGYTEMKGSWSIFDSYRAQEDWCRWRAPFWHGTPVMDEHSHANYHLGFRCRKTPGSFRPTTGRDTGRWFV